MLVKIILNGNEVTMDVKPNEYLLDSLRRYGIKSLKKGCDASSCGVCSVLLDEKPILSCSYLTVKADGHSITTVEGIQEEASRLADSFAHFGADQCGYCSSSISLVLHALVKEYSCPDDEQIKHYLVANLCRCTGYSSQLKAIKHYIGGLKDEKI